MTDGLHQTLSLAILETIADPVFVKDTEHRWIFVNQAFCDLMGQTREALIGRSDVDFFPAHQAKIFWEKDEEAFASSQTIENEESVTVADGTTHVIVTKKAVFAGPDGPVLVGVIRDITERNRMEAELREVRDTLEVRVADRTREVAEAREKLHQAEKLTTLGELAGGLAHDFNNLLAIILLANEEVLSIDGVPEAARRLVNQAIQAASRGGELTRALLAYARCQPLEPRLTDVQQLVDSTMQLMSRTLGPETVLTVERSEAPLLTVIDPSQLQSSLINLAVNARDAMPEGGPLTVRCWGDQQGVHITVRDGGRGIPIAHLSRIFDPFFTTKPMGAGTGLGLSTVHGFVHQSGGSIEVESVLGSGTTFHLCLPERRDAHRPAAR